MVYSKSSTLSPHKATSARSSPIAVPKRKSNYPLCSPPRDQNSPEFVFNFDFSVSPDVSAMTSPLYLQNQGVSTRLFPLQQKAAAFLPLSALGAGNSSKAHPYANEPFLYSLPKAPLRDSQNTYGDACANSSASEVPPVPYGTKSIFPEPSSSDFSAPFLPSATSCLSPDVMDCDEDQPLTSAFRAPLASSIADSSISWSDRDSMSPSSFYRSPSPSPPRMQSPSRRVYSGGRPRQLLLTKLKASQRTVAAAPVVSLNVAQAERPLYGSSRHFPYPANPELRGRRGSIASSSRSTEKMPERTRRMSTVVGRGAGRILHRSASGMSLVSDEDIERSLEMEKDEAEVSVSSRGRSTSRRRRDSSVEHLVEKERRREPEPERGRARGRVPLRGLAAPTDVDRALPAWQ
ncbi:uncharacterized protein TRAVEDRAFT_71626 [Trametes versicolor FP-101664 SS1]|uniref:uncharacterized protein n=1 Tax=Trametes versicolor (strain FP-101664) TaxID=717944 RepID=UPI0004622C8B|nr:uncharacterized protein TRAVEDRAFT_71626 [Trametes versicolor FP-101664 SS1]EIW59617.1 hypothetical protein TRAVEDRAFT_71626 [Trametes versicolor FP-101664 SS1]